MKTIMDAVNELNGDCSGLEGQGGHIWFFDGEYELANPDGIQDPRVRLNPMVWVKVCYIKDFKFTVSELSHAPWIKGPSLAEYQAADKEVLKVENKTVEVEVDGELYQLEKDYEFKNCGDKYWVNGCLDNTRGDDELRFASNGFWWKWCRAIDKSNLGTITPASVKLVDGAAYQFDARGKTLNGIYEKHHNTLNIMVGQYFNLETCTSITRLVPEIK